jgi:FtsP/CotA-like multicopper oxidase with cupredoxin domain
MKKLLLSSLFLLMFGAVAFGQATKVPTCNGFDGNGVPINIASNSTNCTDFFGVANWANSPLPAGTITGFTLINGGSGYTNPVVEITDPTGVGATATATFDSTGAITGISGNGTNYTIPTVTIVDVGPGGTLQAPTCGGAGQPACGSGAMATAIIGSPFTPGTGMLKFQDALPDLRKAIAIADTTTFPGSDFYVIGLAQYTAQMHTSLPPATLRGYCQLASATAPASSCVPFYLGPVILAQKNRPVRVLFRNLLPAGAGGDLFIPMDSTYMGADILHQNRATLHLHGGATPWISDGTPHQWTTPEGDTPMNGVSTQAVPDMYFAGGNIVPYCSAAVSSSCYPNGAFTGGTYALPTGATNTPPAGDMTFFWTNQQGGRLMFYHDHAYGITRLNVYAGEAAGYLLYDPAEETSLANASAPGTIAAGDLTHLIPLVIQDKTFVPSSAQVAAQDPTWAPNFGTTPGTANTGDLWFPHVYVPNQNPADPLGGGNAFGHWDYGPWFFPPQTTLTAADPPTSVTIPCTSAAFPGQVLTPSAANNNQDGCPIIPNPSGTPESFMDTPVVNGKAYPILHVAPAAYRFQILSAGNDRSLNLSWFLADPANPTEVAMVPAVPPGSGTSIPLCSTINPVAVPGLVLGLATGKLDNTGNPLNGTGLPAGCWPNYGPQPGIPAPQTMWAADGRAGGAPDPRNAGPAWVQIGSEGGLLPAPVVIPPTPINYEQNTRSITIGSVAVHGLWLGPAERADVIVDFSQFVGKTLILYNDAPTPAPAIDSRLDYFTGDGDQTPIGGAPNTPPGYGPNTRTIMQVIVDAAAPNLVPFSLPTLKAAFATTAAGPGLFASTQPTTIVPEPNYNSAYNGNFPPVYAPISANTLTFNPLAPQTFEALLSAENLPACTAIPPAQCAPLNHKAIQELFTLDYGRMNATLGTELPNVNFQNQTTIPLGYVDPATEIVRQGDTQLWKITHNGVDSHFIHFHLFNVQVINRVGWDGSLRPPDANEMGWKDTVRMNPLEDIIVALQPITPQTPWPLPNSIRNNDVTGAGNMFSNLDPFSNLGAVTVDGPTNFGWEYVWHCHILGHEENDMMRPIVWQVPPPAPGNLTAAFDTALPGQIDLAFTDNSANETGFILQRDTTSAFSAPTLITVPPLGTLNAAGEGISWGQTVSVTDNPGGGGPYFYRVQAVDDGFTTPKNEQSYNPTSALQSGWSNIVSAALTVPTTTFTGAPAGAVFGSTFTVTASTNAPTLATISGTGPCAVTMLANPTPASTQASVLMTSGTGTCVLTATWPVTANFANATMQQTTVATKATPKTTFTGAPASATYNSSFVVTATTNASTVPTITGTAGVCSVGAVSGTAASANATVTMTSGTGSCVLTATWLADVNYASALTTQTTTATKLNSVTSVATHTPNPSVAGQGVVVTYSVASATALSGGAAGPSGNVTITVNGSSCVGTVAAATCTVTIPNAGTYTVTANYAGDANFNASSGTNGISQQVRDFTMSISPTSQSINGNQQAKYTVTLRSQNGFTGSVPVSCGGTYPSSFSCSMSPKSVNVPAGGSVTTTLTVNTVKGSPGPYTATVTGMYGSGTPSSGGLTHTVNATVTTKN